MAPGVAFRPVDRIVVPSEGTDREFLAQQWAVEFAAAMGLTLHGVHVSDGTRYGEAGDTEDEEIARDVFSYLEKLAEKYDVPFSWTILHGGDVVGLLRDELTARDLCVIGTRRLAHHYHVGSVTAALIESAPCPVQVVRIE
jgi:nucleotide-binding universal stress UspA family protein